MQQTVEQNVSDAGYRPRQVIAVFQSSRSFEAALDALQLDGVDRARISILDAGTDEANARLDALGFVSVKDVISRSDAPKTAVIDDDSVSSVNALAISGIVYVSAVVGAGLAAAASGGLLAPMIVGALGTGVLGGSVGGLLAKCASADRARYIEDNLARGGLAVWVVVTSAEQERTVSEVLARHDGQGVHVYDPQTVPSLGVAGSD